MIVRIFAPDVAPEVFGSVTLIPESNEEKELLLSAIEDAGKGKQTHICLGPKASDRTDNSAAD